MTVLLVTAMVLVVLTIDFMLSRKEAREAAARPATQSVVQPRLVPAVVGGFKVAANVAYHPGHTWAAAEGAQMVRVGCRYAVVETSSEGVKQSRHAAINYDVAVFTNLSRDHFDFHGGPPQLGYASITR